MQVNYNVEHFLYKDRYRNLDVSAKGNVKSEKFFPVYLNNGKEEIFKPLSRTKPLLTPFFAYSEVFWSTVINMYFDGSAPIYRLAICDGYNDCVPKYNDSGTIVPSILDDDETLVNLLEYFMENKDSSVDIDNYVNYCMKTYDYTDIFNSKIIKENESLGESLALNVLISILKADQNYHYENAGFIYKNGVLDRVAPPIDHEFSTFFLFLDDIGTHKEYFNNFKFNMTGDTPGEVLSMFMKSSSKIIKNIDLIVDRYESVVVSFLKSLDLFITDITKNPIKLENHNYLFPFNSDNYKVGIARYKNNDEMAALAISVRLKQHIIDLKSIDSLLNEEILEHSLALQKVLTEKLEIKHQKTLEFK